MGIKYLCFSPFPFSSSYIPVHPRKKETMEMFFNTAYHYLKGESELPSLLPSKESADMAKEKSRKVRLFCKGLECFCEILYAKPVAEEQYVDPNVEHDDTAIVAEEEHDEAPMGQDQTTMTAEQGHPESMVQQNDTTPSPIDTVLEQLVDRNVEYNNEVKVAGGEHIEAIMEQDQTMITAAEVHSKSAVQQNDATPSLTDTVSEKSISNELAHSTDSVQDREHPCAETIVLGTKADQKPRKYVLEPGENLFQSLYATDNTPPTSPGGASSSSTLVDPSSRKVSPSESTLGTKSSPTAAKDFAYSSLDVKHVRGPLSIAEENSKLELLRQLKKKTVGEEKASRKAEKRKAKILALGAELDATKKELRSKEVEADITRAHGNAMILSNFVLRNAMQDGMNAPRDEQHGVEVETIKSAGETVGNQEGEGGLQNNFRSAGTSVASAYSHDKILTESPDELGKGLAHAGASYFPVSIQQEQMLTMSENVEMEHSGCTTAQEVDRRASEEPRPGLSGSSISASASASQLEANAEGFLGRWKRKVNDLSKEIRSDEMTSVESTGSKAFNEVKAQGQEYSTDDTGLPSNPDHQESSSSINRGSWTEVGTKHSDNSDTQVEDLSQGQNQTDEQSFRTGHSITQISTDLRKATLPSTTEITMPQDTGNNSDIVSIFGNVPIKESTEDNELNELSDQGHIPIPHDKDSPLKVEHQADDKPVEVESERGKKRDNAPTDDVGDENSARENPEDESSDEEIEDEEDEEDDVEGTCVGREGGSHNPFEFSEPAGPATLWGILQTSQGGDEAAKEVNAVEEAATVFDAAGPATLWGILHSNQSEHQAKDTTVADVETAEGDQDPFLAPANSPANSPAVNQGRWEPNPDREDRSRWPGRKVYYPELERDPAADRAWREAKFGEDAASATDGKAGEREQSPRAEASPVASEGVTGDVGAKSDDSDFVALARPSETAIPVEIKCPRKLEGEALEAPKVLHMQGTRQDDVQDEVGEKDDQTTYDGTSGITTAEDGEMASGGEATPFRPTPSDSETSSPPFFSLYQAEKFDVIPPKQAQAPGLSKTQKRKLERKRAAAKKVEEAKRLRMEKEAAQSPDGVAKAPLAEDATVGD